MAKFLSDSFKEYIFVFFHSREASPRSFFAPTATESVLVVFARKNGRREGFFRLFQLKLKLHGKHFKQFLHNSV